MSAPARACEHIPPSMQYQVVPIPGPGQRRMRCPCCGLGGCIPATDDPADQTCPCCDVPAVWADTPAVTA
jgi:hypothetical protein